MASLGLLTLGDHVHLLVNALEDERDHPPAVRLYLADSNATWLFSESDPDDPDRLFGLCDLGLGFPELGWASLKEIEAVRGKLGLPVERDDDFVGDKPISVYAEESRKLGRIQV
jgi:hypothetical protein